MKEYITSLSERLNAIAGNKEIYFFARERRSYENLENAFRGSGIRIRLDQDTALHLKRDDVLSKKSSPRKRYKLDAFRQDNEATGLEPSFESVAPHVTLDPAIYAKSFDHWVRIHAASRSIRTNRTHSAILGSILDIPTTMFASSSHKNRSIWEYSLQSRGVVWSVLNDSDRYVDSAVSEPGGRLRGIRMSVLPQISNKIKVALKPGYRIINLPKIRAKYGNKVRQVYYLLKGVPRT